MGYLQDHFPVVPCLSYLGELLPGHGAPDFMHEGDVVLFEPVRGRQHQVGQLSSGGHEEVGGYRVLHIVFQRPLYRQALRCGKHGVRADDPHHSHPVRLAGNHRFPESRHVAARREGEPSAEDRCLFFGPASGPWDEGRPART